MLRLSILISWACTTRYAIQEEMFFLIKNLTLIARKALILLLAYTNVFFYYFFRAVLSHLKLQ